MALASAVTLAGLTGLPFLQPLHDLDIDVLHGLATTVRTNNPSDQASPTVVVALDEATYATPPFSGLPKVMWTPQIAAVQDAILAAGARVIGWDLILPTSAATYVADRNFDAPLLKSFARARGDGRIVLGTAHFADSAILPHRLFSWTVGGAANLRSLNVTPDADGVVRKVPTFLQFRKKDGKQTYIPSMALELAVRMRKVQPVRTSNGAVRLGQTRVHGTAQDLLTLNFASPAGNVPTYSFADLYRCSKSDNSAFFEKHFAGKAVLLGLVLDIEDRKLSSNRLITDGGPIGPIGSCGRGLSARTAKMVPRATTSGVYLHAVAVNNILLGDGLAHFSPAMRALLALPLALLAAIATMLMRLYRAVPSILFAAGAWTALALLLFASAQILPLLAPLLATALTFVIVLGLRFILQGRQGRFLRRAFAQYVAPALVEQLVDDPGQLRLGGERREMSFLFTDLAGFTSLVERQDPEDAVRLLNLYLDRMIEIAKRHGGTIDKLIGDAVVVLFSAPLHQSDHAGRAIACALDMDEFATRFAAEQRKRGVPFGATRIGVNTGVAMIGNLGGSSFFDYTALGDAMNTAARLESVNKHLGTRIAISGETVRHCANFTGRMAGRLILKGKEEKTDVFEPMSSADERSELIERYASAYSLMASKDAQALKTFQDLAADFPDDPLVQLHLGRLKDGETGDVIWLEEK
jgi:adenylate cyclase